MKRVRLLTDLSLPLLLLSGLLCFSSSCERPASDNAPIESRDALREEVLDTERSFAAAMAHRNPDAFASFIDEEAVFLTADGALRGRAGIRAGWAEYFETPDPPFSWSPSRVEVLESGRLALSTGPVLNSQGTCIGTFTSIWRRKPDASWKIIFDRGSTSCDEL